jgi:ATP-dependent exoDNAse (exonuclease V) beta subunit
MLSQLNSNSKDKDISFIEEGHVYNVNGKVFISVTTVIHKFFPHFNADKVIYNMMRNPKFKTGPYAKMTPTQIKDKWEHDREEAANLGTLMHNDIELFINGETPKNPDSVEFKYFMEFYHEVIEGNYKPYRTEWMIYSSNGIAGSIDCVLINEYNELILLDWKRSKEIKMSNPYEKGIGPFKNLDNCNYNHYTLQLNIYRHILETEYNQTVIAMFNVVLHPNNDSYILYQIDRLDISDGLWQSLNPTHHK